MFYTIDTLESRHDVQALRKALFSIWKKRRLAAIHALWRLQAIDAFNDLVSVLYSDELPRSIKMEFVENVFELMSKNDAIKDDKNIAFFKFIRSLQQLGIFNIIRWHELNLVAIIDDIMSLERSGYGYIVELEEIDKFVTSEIEIGEEIDISYIGSGGPSCGGMPRKIYETREEIVKQQKIIIKADKRFVREKSQGI